MISIKDAIRKLILKYIPVHTEKIVNNLSNDALLGKSLYFQLLQRIDNINNIHEAEFSVYSQWGDDGIIQFLIHVIQPQSKVFVEFGVENFLESNTRFLMENNNWSGLVMDGNPENVEQIRRMSFYWKYDLTAIASFITAENINQLILDHAPNQDVSLLHVDIDGNDYWVWKAINVINPEIAIIEYNSIFGVERPVTVPYDPQFVRQEKHYSYLYAGSSLLSLCDLAEEKGYALVGCNSAGNNAYFVRKDKLGKLKGLDPGNGYVESKFRESRDEEGKLNFLRGKERLEAIRGLPVFNTRTNQTETL